MIFSGSYRVYEVAKEDYGLISSSDIKGCKTPLHFITKYNERKKKDEKPEQPQFVFGSAFHCLMLEEEKFYKEYTTFDESLKPFPDKDYRNAENKKFRDEFFEGAQQKGMICLTKEDYDTLLEMKKQAYIQLPKLAQILDFENGIAENNIFNAVQINPETRTIEKFVRVTDYDDLKNYTIENNYLRLACKPDYFNIGKKYCLDLKTTNNSEPDDFSKQIAAWEYFIQAAWNMDMLTCEYGTTFEDFFFIAVEKSSPYHCAWFRCDDSMIEYGRWVYWKRLVNIFECFRDNNWPGMEIYSKYEKAQGCIDLALPKWAITEKIF